MSKKTMIVLWSASIWASFLGVESTIAGDESPPAMPSGAAGIGSAFTSMLHAGEFDRGWCHDRPASHALIGAIDHSTSSQTAKLISLHPVTFATDDIETTERSFLRNRAIRLDVQREWGTADGSLEETPDVLARRENGRGAIRTVVLRDFLLLAADRNIRTVETSKSK